MSWLGDYLAYTKHQESPEVFHFWVGLTTMAAVLNRKVWVDRRSRGVSWYHVYPGQMMTCLVAPSGRGHKSTAMRLGRSLMTKMGVKVIKGKGSAEKIINLVAGGPNRDAIATIVAPELSVFLSKATYAEALVDFLMDIYDAEDPFDYMTQSGGTIRMRNPCLTALMGATPKSIGDSIPEKAHETGYTGRILHVYHSGIEKAEDPLVDIDDSALDKSQLAEATALQERLIEGLEQMQQLSGPFVYTKEGRDWFSDWYRKWKKSSVGQGEGYYARKQDHVLRVAQLLRVSQHMDLVLDVDAIRAAVLALDNVESGFQYAFFHVGHTPFAQNCQRIVEVIRVQGGRTTSSKLFNNIYKFFSGVDEIRAALRTLRESGVLHYDGVIKNEEYWSLVQRQ